MPFKDNANDPDPEKGWSPDRSKDLGASALDAVVACLAWLCEDVDREPPEGG